MKTKSFDCVEMKCRIQQEMAEEEARLGREEAHLRRMAWQQSSAAPLARWWRTVAGADEESGTCVMREDTPMP